MLEPYQNKLCGIAVESTFNWYWLFDGLQAHGYPVQLVNTAAVVQYDGLKYSGDHHDAFHLASDQELCNPCKLKDVCEADTRRVYP